MDRSRSAATPSPPIPPRPHFYIPCLQGFTTQLRRYWNNRIALAASSRFPIYDDFETLCVVAARAYLHLHHHAQYQAHDLVSPSPVQTRLTVGAIRLPPYVLAMIRELARPMTLDSHTILLPYLPLLTSNEARGQGPAPPLGFKLPIHPQVVSLLAGAHRLVPLVDSAAEAAEARALESPCPAFLCRGDGRALVIYAGRALANREPFPNWRLVAVSVLKHLRPDCAWIAGCDLSDEAWSVEGARGGGVRCYRCDQDFPLEAEEEQEGGGTNGAGVGDGQEQGQHHRRHHYQLQEGQGRVWASMPPLLKHLDSSTEADCPGYVVRCFSTQGADVWAPFPTLPPLLEWDGGSDAGRFGGVGDAAMVAGAAGSLDASGSGSGKWWKRK